MEAQRECEYCHEMFTPKRVDTVYCSASCRQMAYIRRNQLTKTSFSGLSMADNENSRSNRSIIDQGERGSINKNVNSAVPELQNVNGEETDAGENVNYDDVVEIKAVNSNTPKSEASIESVNSEETKLDQPEEEKKYVNKMPAFLQLIWDEVGEMDRLDRLSTQYLRMHPEVYWVCVRIRCLVECLLTFSEMKEIELDDLKEVYNALTILMRSTVYERLPNSFPYFSEMEFWQKSLKELCLNEEEVFRFRMKNETKAKLIAIRFEMSQYVPKEAFSKLEFHFTVKR